MSSPSASPELTATANQLGVFVSELRQARGLSYNDVSVRLKYSVLQLEALEQENWAALPAGVPLRWMIKSYARLLETDEQVLLDMLDDSQVAAPKRSARDVRKGTSWASADTPLYTEPSQRSWGWLLVIGVLVLIALFYALDQGLIPESWLVFDWLKEFQS